MTNPKRGEIWLVDLNPTRGQEIQKTRPVVVITADLVLQVRSLSTERFIRKLGQVPPETLQELLSGLIICVDYEAMP